jgi:hypothetical protein
LIARAAWGCTRPNLFLIYCFDAEMRRNLVRVSKWQQYATAKRTQANGTRPSKGCKAVR